MTIVELFGLRPVTAYRSGHGIINGLPLPDQLVGVELEIENWSFGDIGDAFGGCSFAQDGSLRNNGMEAITKPIATKYLENWLKAFFAGYRVTENNYSERCSTHVHFNVQPLTIDQLISICLIYQTVESLLFRFVGNEREQNIFCVPWNQCNLNADIVGKMASSPANANGVFRRWQKYAAMNLIPITTQGTIEFRHLHGTCDVGTIMDWVTIVSCIFRYAKSRPMEEIKNQILNMNTVSNYSVWLFEVFDSHTSKLTYEGFEKDLAKGVVDSKLMLLNYNPGNVPVMEEIHDILDPDEGEDDWLAEAARVEQENERELRQAQQNLNVQAALRRAREAPQQVAEPMAMYGAPQQFANWFVADPVAVPGEPVVIHPGQPLVVNPVPGGPLGQWREIRNNLPPARPRRARQG